MQPLTLLLTLLAFSYSVTSAPTPGTALTFKRAAEDADAAYGVYTPPEEAETVKRGEQDADAAYGVYATPEEAGTETVKRGEQDADAAYGVYAKPEGEAED